MAEVHICLVSDQLLPNIIPILMHRPIAVHLVASNRMRGKAEALERFLTRRGIPVYHHDAAPDANYPAISAYAEQVALTVSETPNIRIVLNATGGNKLMTLGFVPPFRELGADVVYTDTQHLRLEHLDRQQEPEPMPEVLDIPTYLEAQGMTYRSARSDDGLQLKLMANRKPLTKYIAQHAADIPNFLSALNGMASQALDRQGKELQTPEQRFETMLRSRERKAMQRIASTDLVEWDKAECITFKDADSARYLGGMWLEEYIWHVARDEQPHDVRLGVNGTWDVQGGKAPRNEFDLLVAHHNRLLVVECKTLRLGQYEEKDAQILYKLDSLGDELGGLFGRLLLLSARAVSELVQKRAHRQRIDLLAAHELKNVREYLRGWMRS